MTALHLDEVKLRMPSVPGAGQEFGIPSKSCDLTRLAIHSTYYTIGYKNVLGMMWQTIIRTATPGLSHS